MPAVRFARAWARLFVFAAVTLALGAHPAGAQAPAGQPAEKPARSPRRRPPRSRRPARAAAAWKIDADTFEGLRARALGPAS
jgi:hypothetical protein